MGHRGHGKGRILGAAMCRSLERSTHDPRLRQLPRGTMTGGNQPTNIRGINRRRKVPGAHCLQMLTNRPRSPDRHSEVMLDRSIHISSPLKNPGARRVATALAT